MEDLLRNAGRTYKKLMEFILRVKSGQEQIIIAYEYVLMDKKFFDKMMAKKEHDLIFMDEFEAATKFYYNNKE